MLFNNQYYYFIAGLPDISFDSTRLPFTVAEFRNMLEEELKPKDLKLIDKYFLNYDNDNLLGLLKDKDFELDPKGKLSKEQISETVEGVKEGLTVKNSDIPPYFETFIENWLGEETHDEGGKLWEDMLTSLYMDYGIEVKNTLISNWFEMNLNIGNVLSAIYARKYNLNVAKYIVGNNKIANIMRSQANTRDFGISQELEYFDTLTRIAEEDGVYDRERKLDKLRWNWLEDNTIFDYFNIEYIFAYLCKLQILERWVSLNAEEGEKIFREMIDNLKKDVNVGNN
ncbi:MAG: DUF2764 family protein [Fermentimonas sp.]|jgi:hypothetical protein